jgi:hypothetical protein
MKIHVEDSSLLSELRRLIKLANTSSSQKERLQIPSDLLGARKVVWRWEMI